MNENKWLYSVVIRKGYRDGFCDYRNGFDNRRSPSEIMAWLIDVDLDEDLYDDYMIGYCDGVKDAIGEKHDDEERTLREKHDEESTHVNWVLLHMLNKELVA